MPPWGKGPVQGKIHGHPEYIEENFPKTDRFKGCKVERLRQGGGPSETGAKQIIYKADKITDEEEFHKARNMLKEQHDQAHKIHRTALLRKELGKSTMMTYYGGIAVIVVVVIVILAVGRRKKVSSKSN